MNERLVLNLQPEKLWINDIEINVETIPMKIVERTGFVIKITDNGFVGSIFENRLKNIELYINNKVIEVDQKEILTISNPEALTKDFFFDSEYKLFVLPAYVKDVEEKTSAVLDDINENYNNENNFPEKFMVFIKEQKLSEEFNFEVYDLENLIQYIYYFAEHPYQYFLEYKGVFKHLKEKIIEHFSELVNKENIESIEKESKDCLQAVFTALIRDSSTYGIEPERRTINRVIQINDENKKIIIFGDIHGDFTSIKAIFEEEQILDRLILDNDFMVIFLGDYLDRGLRQLPVLRFILFLKKIFNGKVVLLRGNHETLGFETDDQGNKIPVSYGGGQDNMSSFVNRYRSKFGYDYFIKLHNYFKNMPIVVFLKSSKFLLMHGGIPPYIEGNPDKIEDIYPYIDDLNDLNKEDEYENGISYTMDSLLWARPKEDTDWVMRGSDNVSYFFGKQQLLQFLKKIGAEKMIRGHDPEKNGYSSIFDDRLITLHSTGGLNNDDTHYSGDIRTPATVYLRDDEITLTSYTLKTEKVLYKNLKIIKKEKKNE